MNPNLGELIGAFLFLGVIVAGSIGFYKFGVPRLILHLATLDVWWSIYRLDPPEGEMYILTQSTPDRRESAFIGLIESLPKYWYDPEKKVLVEIEKIPDEALKERVEKAESERRESYLGKLRVSKVGLNKQLLVRELSYEKLKQVGTGKDIRWDLVGVHRNDPSIYFQYNMALRITEAEDRDNVPLNLVVNFTVQMFSPYLAYFFAGDWASQVSAGVMSTGRKYSSRKDFNTLKKERAAYIGDDGLPRVLNPDAPSPRFKSLAESIVRINFDHFGVRIIDCRVVTVDPIEDKEVEEAMRADKMALLKGNATVTTAQKGMEAAAHEAEGLKKILTVRHELDRDGVFATADAIRYTGATAVSLGGNHAALPTLPLTSRSRSTSK